jgi:hypothetical protein
MKEKKICPIMSEITTHKNRYGGEVSELCEENCRQERCAWRDKCFEEKPEPEIEKIDLNDAFNCIGTELLKMHNNDEITDSNYGQACNYIDWLSYLINEGADLDERN